MQYLPTHCEGCGRVALSPQRREANVACLSCSGTTQVVPGPSFAEHEQGLFADLTLLVRAAQLRAAEGQRLCIDLENGLLRSEQGPTLERAAARLPGLATRLSVLGGSPALQARTLRMLLTILNALAFTRKSGSLAAVSLPESLFAREGDQRR